MDNYLFKVLVEKDADGYFAKCLDLDGCSTQGDTYEEALLNIKDAISLYVADLKAENQFKKEMFSDQISFTTVPVYA